MVNGCFVFMYFCKLAIWYIILCAMKWNIVLWSRLSVFGNYYRSLAITAACERI